MMKMALLNMTKTDVHRLKQKEIMKCDMCTSCSEKDGSKPMCVEKCPMGAITLQEV